jgi:pyruvate dehydrogenase E1 component beta subunit
MAEERSLTFAAATRAALEQLVDSGVALLGDTVGMPGSPTEGLKASALPASDRGAAGVALGMAMAGTAVVLELPDAGRLASIADTLAEAARLAATDFAPTLVVRVPYGQLPGLDAPIGRVLAPIDGLAVLCPSTPAGAAGLLLHAAQRRGPTVVLEGRALAQRRGSVRLEAQAPELVERRPGTHVTIASWGDGVSGALAAAEQLAHDGIDAQVVELQSLLPLPVDALGEHVRRTGRLVVAHPADDVLADLVRVGGLDAAFLYLESPLATVQAAPSAIARAARDAVFY